MEFTKKKKVSLIKTNARFLVNDDEKVMKYEITVKRKGKYELSKFLSNRQAR